MELSNYNGLSMNPIFLPGDGLKIVPYQSNRIRIGDVVAFPDPTGSRNIVHRVIHVDKDGIRTRGDNCNYTDPWVLRPEDIIGRVVSVHRKNRSRAVTGGRWGAALGSFLRIKNDLSKCLFKTLSPLYRWLAEKGFSQTICSSFIRPRILCFKRQGGAELQLIIGKYVIGRRLPGTNEWQIKRPFKLFVDVERLKS